MLMSVFILVACSWPGQNKRDKNVDIEVSDLSEAAKQTLLTTRHLAHRTLANLAASPAQMEAILMVVAENKPGLNMT